MNQALDLVRPQKPRLVLRVGVTGHRDLGRGDASYGEAPAVGRAVSAVLQRIAGLAEGLHGEDAGRAYTAEKPLLRIVSPLATGADQIVAAHGLAQGFELFSPLPFPDEIYREDFRGDAAERLFKVSRSALPETSTAETPLAAYEDLLLAAGDRRLALDGSKDEAVIRDLSYEAVGRLVVSRSDILLALWDGERAAGTGGTGDIVEAALNVGTPVLWISPADPSRLRLLLQRDELPWWCKEPDGRCAHEGDEVYPALCERLAPPLLLAHPKRAAKGGGFLQGKQVTLDDYLAERKPGDSRFGRIYDCLYKWIGGAGPSFPDQETPPIHPSSAADYYRRAYGFADAYAVKYSNAYRSSYIVIFLLAALALSAAVVAVAFKDTKLIATLVEFAALLGIVSIFVRAHFAGWHQRWLAYRLLAELLRPAIYLALLGQTLPFRQPAAARVPDPRYGWVLTYFLALTRAAPAEPLSLTQEHLERVRAHVGAGLVEDQRRYQAKRAARSERVANCLLNVGLFLFGLTFIVVIVKLLGFWLDVGWATSSWIGIWAGIFPAFGAAAFAIRQQSEFEVLEKRSHAMAEAFEEIAARLEGIDLSVPLASERIGQEIALVAEQMLAELFEWMTIFVTKPPEVA